MSCYVTKLLTFLAFLVSLLACSPQPVEEAPNTANNTVQKMADVNRILLRKDKLRIQGYIQRHKLSMSESGTGLWYVIKGNDTGTKVVRGMEVKIEYSVELLDGTLCYDSKELGPKIFRTGKGGVEAGLEEGVLKMQKGDTALFIMPPHLAHGLSGDQNKIPPRAILVYHVELVDLR